MKRDFKLRFLIVAFVMMFTVSGAFADFSFREITLKFAQISDTHVSDRAKTTYKMLNKSKLLLMDSINQANKTPNLDFVIFTGDLVDEPIQEYYKDFFTIATESKYPVLFAFGNHDYRNFSSNDDNQKDYLTREEVLTYIKSLNPNYPFNKSFYAFSPKRNFRIVVLDLAVDEMSSNGKISLEQLNFLDNQIKSNPRDTILIFQHFPAVEPFEAPHHRILNSDEYLAVVRQYKNPIFIFSGHYHTTKITREENIVHVSTPSMVTYPNAFRVISITDFKDRVEADFEFKETTHKQIQAESKADTISASIFKGIEKYQEKTIVIYKDKKVVKKVKKEEENKEKEDI